MSPVARLFRTAASGTIMAAPSADNKDFRGTTAWWGSRNDHHRDEPAKRMTRMAPGRASTKHDATGVPRTFVPVAHPPVRGTLYKGGPLAVTSPTGTPPSCRFLPKGNLAHHERPRSQFRPRLVVPPRPEAGPESWIPVITPTGTTALPSPPANAPTGTTALPAKHSERRTAGSLPASSTTAAAGIHPALSTHPPSESTWPQAPASDQTSGCHPDHRVAGIHDRNSLVCLEHRQQSRNRTRG